MSDINVSVLDQQLQLTSTPTVAAQGVNEDYIVFDFLDNSWSGFSMVALFFAEDSPEAVYQSVVNSSGRALVPWEATQTDGAMYFGLAGVKGDIRYTSELVRYKIVAGLYEGAESVEPTPSVYEQWAEAVSEYAANVADLTGDVEELSDRLDIAEALQTDTMSGSKIVTYTSEALTAQYDSALQQYYVEYAVALPAGASVLETEWSRGASDVWQQSDLRTTMSASTATVRHTLEAQSAYTYKIRATIAYPESADLAELQDIRVGADGTTYASAGAAVRAQAMQLDSTLTEAGKAADAKATGDAVADLKDEISEIDPGLSDAAKVALLACFQKVAWVDEHGQSYYDDLEAALYPNYPKITCEYDKLGVTTTDDTLETIKNNLIVKWYQNKQSSGTVLDANDYTVSGTIAEGNKEFTVAHDGVSANIIIPVYSSALPSGYTKYDYICAPLTGTTGNKAVDVSGVIKTDSFANLNRVSVAFDVMPLSNRGSAHFCLLGGLGTDGDLTTALNIYGKGSNVGVLTICHRPTAEFADCLPTNKVTHIRLNQSEESPSVLQIGNDEHSLEWTRDPIIQSPLHLFVGIAPNYSQSNTYITTNYRIGNIITDDGNGQKAMFYPVTNNNVIGFYDIVSKRFFSCSNPIYATVGNSSCQYTVGNWQ